MCVFQNSVMWKRTGIVFPIPVLSIQPQLLNLVRNLPLRCNGDLTTDDLGLDVLNIGHQVC